MKVCAFACAAGGVKLLWSIAMDAGSSDADLASTSPVSIAGDAVTASHSAASSPTARATRHSATGGSPLAAPWKGKPVTRNAYVNDDGELKPLDAMNFSAAGALLWHRDRGALLAVEDRKGGLKYNFLGGKRDHAAETPRMVAVRECREETGGLLSQAAQCAMLEQPMPVVWSGTAKYALFVHELQDEDYGIAERIAAIGGRPSPEHDANLHGVAFVPMKLLLDPRWRKVQMHDFASCQAAAAHPILLALVSRSSTTNFPTDIAAEALAALSLDAPSVSASAPVVIPGATPTDAAAHTCKGNNCVPSGLTGTAPEARLPTKKNVKQVTGSARCKFYALGTCKRGDACRFLHVDGDGDADAERACSASSASVTASPLGQSHKKRVCKYFQFGSCRNGEACRFLHVVEGSGAVAAAASGSAAGTPEVGASA